MTACFHSRPKETEAAWPGLLPSAFFNGRPPAAQRLMGGVRLAPRLFQERDGDSHVQSAAGNLFVRGGGRQLQQGGRKAFHFPARCDQTEQTVQQAAGGGRFPFPARRRPIGSGLPRRFLWIILKGSARRTAVLQQNTAPFFPGSAAGENASSRI